MNLLLEGVLPVGTPWGGPESRRFLSCFVSMLMHIEKCGGTEQEMRSRHERLYHLYLAVSGIGAAVAWTDGLVVFNDEQMVEYDFPDYIQRTMAYAGYAFTVMEADCIQAQPDDARRKIVASINNDNPVLACSTAAQWSIIVGYEDDGETLIGWDGSNGYWGAPAITPECYLENGMFAARSLLDSTSRLVFIEGKSDRRDSTKEVLSHLVDVMKKHRSLGCNAEFYSLMQDDAYCQTTGEQELRCLWELANGFAGWYAENRCFLGAALSEELMEMRDVRAVDSAGEAINKAAGFMFHTHDICWEAWRALRVKHRCDLREEERCKMCGGCLRLATDEDYEAFRKIEPRRKMMGYFETIAANDANAVRELEKCLAVL